MVATIDRGGVIQFSVQRGHRTHCVTGMTRAHCATDLGAPARGASEGKLCPLDALTGTSRDTMTEARDRRSMLEMFEAPPGTGIPGEGPLYASIDFESSSQKDPNKAWVEAGIVAYRIRKDGIIVASPQRGDTKREDVLTLAGGIDIVSTHRVSRPITDWCPGARRFWDHHPVILQQLQERCGTNADPALKLAGCAALADIFEGLCALGGEYGVTIVTDFTAYDGAMLLSAVAQAKRQSVLYTRTGGWRGDRAILDTDKMSAALTFAGLNIRDGVRAICQEHHTHDAVADAAGIAVTHSYLLATAAAHAGFPRLA